jgi:hypothetical protein
MRKSERLERANDGPQSRFAVSLVVTVTAYTASPVAQDVGRSLVAGRQIDPEPLEIFKIMRLSPRVEARRYKSCRPRA